MGIRIGRHPIRRGLIHGGSVVRVFRKVHLLEVGSGAEKMTVAVRLGKVPSLFNLGTVEFFFLSGSVKKIPSKEW